MSTTVLSDIYRHFARKSTVSRNAKIPPKNSSSTLESVPKDEKMPIVDIKQKEKFCILPDNETEQMIIEPTNEEIIHGIVQDIGQQISDEFLKEQQDSDRRQTIANISLDDLDADNNASKDSTNIEEIRSNEDLSMHENEQSSLPSQLEVQVLTSNVHPPSCTCQCHQTTLNSSTVNTTTDYYLFEHTLKQIRQENEQEKILNNNRLLQTLKVQHQELINFYQSQLNLNKVDREQQTMPINQHDTQIQTESMISATRIQNLQPNIPNNINGTNTSTFAKAIPSVQTRPQTNYTTPIRTTGPSLQEIIPSLSTNTSTSVNRVVGNNSITSNPTIPSPSLVPHDFVDLTEDDDHDHRHDLAEAKHALKPPEPAILPRQSSLPSTTAVRTQTADRRNTVTSLEQLNKTTEFMVRPLPPSNQCDYTMAQPQLNTAHDNMVVRLTWNLPRTNMESIKTYEIYAYKQNLAGLLTDWKKIGTVKSMRLPMVVTLKEFQSNCYYAFSVRAISINDRIGPFSELKTVFIGNKPIEPLNKSQILNVTS